MDLALGQVALACAAAALAGAINAVGGGGTFVTFPTLLWLGLPAIEANATSSAALWLGFVGSMWAYRQQFKTYAHQAKSLVLVSTIGSAIGAAVLLAFDDAAFARLVPWLVGTATLLFAVAPWLQRRAAEATAPTQTATTALLVVQLAIAVYGGYFGGGMGILMLAAFATCGMADVHGGNALKSLLAFVINATAVLVFAGFGPLRWSLAVPMAVAAVAGGYAGAKLATGQTPQVVRRLVLALGAAVTIAFFCK